MANYDYGHDTISAAQQRPMAGRRRLPEVPGQQVRRAHSARRVLQRHERLYHRCRQNLTDATVTLEVKPADNFIWRIEYRGDFSNQSPFFNSSGAAKKNQQLFMLGFLYNFSTKS